MVLASQKTLPSSSTSGPSQRWPVTAFAVRNKCYPVIQIRIALMIRFSAHGKAEIVRMA